MEFDIQNGMSGNAPKKSSLRVIVALLIFIALIAVGIWMFLWNKSPQEEPNNLITESDSAGSAVDITNDTTTSIEQDLGGTDLGDVDSEFQDIDQELQNL